MQQKAAHGMAGNTDSIRPDPLSGGAPITLLLLTLSWLPSVSYGEGSNDQEVVQDPAPVAFTVGARVDQLYFFPCNDCHAFMDPVSEVRELDVEEGHPANLEHGVGQIWCESCHDPSDYDRLRNLLADPVDFDKGYQVCSGCHSQKYRDWTHGAHGKRAANWRGERRIYSCVQCHNPHRPSILPRAPRLPPPIRAGLEAMAPVEVDDARDSRRPEWEQVHGQ